LQELWVFILNLNDAVRDTRISSVKLSGLSAGVKALVDVLREMSTWVSEIPPLSQAARFGNPAFRTWHARLLKESVRLLSAVLGAGGKDVDPDIADELAAYLETSFGNETRIDYGTGHEAHFCLLMHLLDRVGVFREADYAALALVVFPEYLRTCRRLQTDYRLEPAGSHGVWGLDDYSFLPFLWGSSQLKSNTRIKPTVVEEDLVLEEERGEYLYLEAIAFIKQVKKGPFFEHSPMLFDISRVRAGWPKINQGMLKMYKGEVWHKRPVVQGFLFGTLFPFIGTEKIESGAKPADSM
jgi:serine/threonine-protein phosphatase 2A activator